ncbi:MAG: YbaN family protein [Myxococcota bacterium]|nr:YbaN family protein [Myxococcota bacterium]
MGSVGKVFLIVAGVLSLTLGVIGIVVPLLPTTPLLLLAAACFVRSSDRLYRWLMNHRIFGPYIKNYREHRAVTFRTKAFTLVLLWVAIGYSTIFVVNALWLQVVLVLIAVAVTVHVLSLNTMSRGAETQRGRGQNAECRVQNGEEVGGAGEEKDID